MTLENIDVASLRDQVNVDGVAIGQLGQQYPLLEQELIDAARYGSESGFGRTAFVILDHTPSGVATTRDVAQEILITTNFDTVIVRAPVSGAVVSHDYSRAAIESAQYDFLADPEIAAASRTFMDTLNHQSYPWMAINLIIAGLILFSIVATVYFARKVKSIN